MRTIVAGFAVLLAVGALPSVASAQTMPVRRTVERTVDGAPRVRIQNPVGDVTVVGDDRPTVRVTARVRASTDDAAKAVAVDVSRTGAEVAVVVKLPQSSGFWQILDRRKSSVDLTVTMPRASALTAHVSVGDLQVASVAGAIDAKTGTGDVHLRDAGADVSANAGVGDVRIELVPRWSAAHVLAHAGTGDVYVRAPSGLRAHVITHAGVGDVRNDLGTANVATPTIEARAGVGDVTIASR